MDKIHNDEHATILAALHVYQRELVRNGEVPPEDVHDIATNGGTVAPLDSAGIDDLCERLNCAGAVVLQGEEPSLTAGPSV